MRQSFSVSISKFCRYFADTIIHAIQASYALNTQLRAPKVDKTYQKITAVDSFVRKNDFIYLLQNILEPGIFKVLYGVL